MSQPRWVFFVTETRMGMDKAGQLYTEIPGLSGRAWARGVTLPNIGLSVRVQPRLAAQVHTCDADFAVPLPNFSGWLGLASHMPAVLWALTRAIRQAQVVVVRVPTVTSVIATILASSLKKPLAVEVVGDVQGVAASGALGPLGRILAPIIIQASRYVVKQGWVVRYITTSVLQETYPSHHESLSFHASAAVIREDDFGVWREEEKSQHPIMLAIGSQENHYKGHQNLIRALPQLLKRFPDLVLVLIGQGKYQAHLRELAHDLGVSAQVQFRGYVSDRASLTEELSKAWLFAMPSLTEGQGRALIEACAVGVPAIGSRTGGIVELLSDGYMFQPEDVAGIVAAAEPLLESAEARAAASRSNQRTAEAYCPEQVRQRLGEWNDTLASLGSSRSRMNRREWVRSVKATGGIPQPE